MDKSIKRYSKEHVHYLRWNGHHYYGEDIHLEPGKELFSISERVFIIVGSIEEIFSKKVLTKSRILPPNTISKTSSSSYKWWNIYNEKLYVLLDEETEEVANSKDICTSCHQELSWISLALICSNCRRIYC